MPRGLIAAMMILLVFAALMLLFAPGGGGADAIKDSDNPLPAAIDEAKGDGTSLGDFVNSVGLAGLVASFFSIIFAYSRQLFALSRAGYLPARAVGDRRAARRRASRCIVPGAIGFLLAAITEDGATMLNIAVFGATVSYVLMMLSHIVLRLARARPRARLPDARRHADLGRRARARAARRVVATFLVDEKAALHHARRLRRGGARTSASTRAPPGSRRPRRSSRRSRAPSRS